MSDQEWTAFCPTCGTKVVYRGAAKVAFFPFCSERCKLIDLGKWLDEEHRIVEPVSEAPGQMKEAEGEG